MLPHVHSQALQSVLEGVQIRVFFHRAAPLPQVVFQSDGHLFQSIHNHGLVGVRGWLALLEELHDVLHHLCTQGPVLLRLRLSAQGCLLLLLLLLLRGRPSPCNDDAWDTGDKT
jgi:hypothetical protein